MVLVASGQHVESRDGSIYVREAGGKVMRLTESGEDHDPALSASGDQVVYVRTRAAKDAGADEAISEIRIRNINTGVDDAVLRGPVSIDRDIYYTFGTPRFSPDAKTVYFLFNWSVTTHGLARLELSTHEIKFLFPAISFPAVIYRGQYAGDLIVLQKRPKLSLGDYSLYYLFTPDGKEVGVVGDKEFDVGIFLDPDGDLK